MGVIIALVLVAIGMALWRDNASKQVLPDGTVLVLSGVQIGRSNVYSHGMGLSKMLGRFVPSNGVNVGRFRLQRAQRVMMPAFEGRELLTAELRLVSGP